jgi:hypothetical protein
MKQIPDTFTLFGQQWQIRTADAYELGDDLGQCRADQHEIVISPNQNAETLIHTILHELVHCIELKLDLELTERQVDLVALGLIDLFRNNANMLSLLERQL